jgi:hypothetical protein
MMNPREHQSVIRIQELKFGIVFFRDFCKDLVDAFCRCDQFFVVERRFLCHEKRRVQTTSVARVAIYPIPGHVYVVTAAYAAAWFIGSLQGHGSLLRILKKG